MLNSNFGLIPAYQGFGLNGLVLSLNTTKAEPVIPARHKMTLQGLNGKGDVIAYKVENGVKYIKYTESPNYSFSSLLARAENRAVVKALFNEGEWEIVYDGDEMTYGDAQGKTEGIAHEHERSLKNQKKQHLQYALGAAGGLLALYFLTK